MTWLTERISELNSLVWGWPMLVLILITGIYLSLGLKGLTITKLPKAFSILWRGRANNNERGEISPFNALMSSLSATIGTGNIAGVATAIAMGGPGALFWMWLTALFGMATKYAEAVLAVHYRETNSQGEHIGGPMYYIQNGLGKKWKWLAILFSFFGAIAGFGIGNTVQSHSVADSLNSSFNIPTWATGIVLTVLAGLIIIGGIKRIGAVAGKLVPIMATAYIIAGLWVLISFVDQIPSALQLIIDSAFSGHAAIGGFTGSAMMAAMRFGIARGIFSNEAGLGSAPIAHAHAKTNSPTQQGLIAMLGTFIDTLVICSITGLAIIVTDSWHSGDSGAPLTASAFAIALPNIGEYIVSIGISVFAFTTIIGWSVYGERCVTYLLGEQYKFAFRCCWIIAIFFRHGHLNGVYLADCRYP